MDQAGDLGSRPDDVLLLGNCDNIVRELCEALGDDWVRDLDAAWKEMEKYGKQGGEESKAVEGLKDAESTAAVKDEKVLAESKVLRDEVEELTRQVEKVLQLEDAPEKVEEASPPAQEADSGDDKGVSKSTPASSAAENVVATAPPESHSPEVVEKVEVENKAEVLNKVEAAKVEVEEVSVEYKPTGEEKL